jgi:hypothetical protein
MRRCEPRQYPEFRFCGFPRAATKSKGRQEPEEDSGALTGEILMGKEIKLACKQYVNETCLFVNKKAKLYV